MLIILLHQSTEITLKKYFKKISKAQNKFIYKNVKQVYYDYAKCFKQSHSVSLENNSLLELTA